MGLGDRESRLERSSSRLGATLWWTFLALLFLSAAYLCYISLTVNAQPSTPSPDKQIGSPSPLNPGPVTSSSADIQGRLDEMSKRIEETGNHSTRILQVIGILIGFMTLVVAIGLWNAKQYVDRVVEFSKADLRGFIREETTKELASAKSSLDDHVRKNAESKMDQIRTEGISAIDALGKYQVKVAQNLKSQAESRIDAYLRVGLPLIERFQRIFIRAIDTAYEQRLITSEGRDTAKKEMGDVVWIQTEVTRALAQLESLDEDTVLAGSQTLSALGDRTCLSALELARFRWSDNSKLAEQLSMVHQKLLSEHN